MRPRYRAECATERSAGLGEVHSTGPRNNTVNGDTFRTRGNSERRERHVRGAVNGAERPFRKFWAFCFVHWRNK